MTRNSISTQVFTHHVQGRPQADRQRLWLNDTNLIIHWQKQRQLSLLQWHLDHPIIKEVTAGHVLALSSFITRFGVLTARGEVATGRGDGHQTNDRANTSTRYRGLNTTNLVHRSHTNIATAPEVLVLRNAWKRQGTSKSLVSQYIERCDVCKDTHLCCEPISCKRRAAAKERQKA